MRAAMLYRINQEIKFLYIKKTNLSEQLHRKHLECSAIWPNSWLTIQDIIGHNLQEEMESHYEKLNKKLDILQRKWNHYTTHMDHQNKTSTYPRTINLTNMVHSGGTGAPGPGTSIQHAETNHFYVDKPRTRDRTGH